VELAADFGEAHAQLGWSLALRKRWKEAEAAYRQARALEFSIGDIASYSILALSVGNFSLAHETLEEARAGAPQNPIAHRYLVFANAALGNWSVASELYESGTRVFVPWREGTNIWMHWLVGRGALGEARKLPVDEPLSTEMLARLDAPDDALALLRDALAGSAAGDPIRRRDIGLWAAHFGDEQMALEALRSAIDEQAGQMVYIWLPQVANVRRLPQFKAYLRDSGLVDYWQEYGWPPLCRPLPGDDFECD
jgi:tetratricopeptide (TPR) repeat protein